MGLILRGPHNNLPSGATISGTKLTIQQMDNNFIFLQNLVSGEANILTNTDALNLINDGNVQQGAYYLISGAHPGLYGTTSQFTYGLQGTNIILVGLDENNFSKNGWGQFYNPNYASYSVWDYTGSTEYSIGDIVIFGGQVWQSLTGELGESSGSYDGYDGNSYISLDENWQVQSYTSSYYNVVWDEIEYDIVNDYICSRYETINNNLVRHSTKDYWFYCGISPIQGFRWGSFGFNPSTVINCSVIDSYFGCLNFVSGYISDVELTNYSAIYSLYIENSGELEAIKLSNYSYMYSLDINSGSFTTITLDNYSNINNFTLNNSYIDYVNLENYSNMNNFTLNNDSYIQYVNLNNESSINYFTIHDDGCYIQNVNLNNNSNLNNFDLYNSSYINYVDITNNSTINYFSLSDASNDDGSFFEYINLSNYSSISHAYLYNTSYFQFITLNNQSIITRIHLCDGTGGGSYLSNINLDNNSSIINAEIDDIDVHNYLEDGSYMSNIKLENYSTITYGVNLTGGSYIMNSNLNYSGLQSLSFTNSNLNYITLNNAYMGLIQMDTSYITEVNVINGCFNYNYNFVTQQMFDYSGADWIYLSNNSYMDNIDIEDSIISGYINLNNSFLQSIRLTNFSTISGGSNEDGDTVNDESSYSYQIIMSASNISYLTLNNNSLLGLGYVNLTNSAMYNVSIDNFSYMTGYLTLDTSAIGQLTMENHSKFGRGNNNSDGYSGSIQLWGDSAIEYMTMNNNAIVDGPILITASTITNLVLEGSINTGTSSVGTPYYELYEEWNEINLGADHIIFGNGFTLDTSIIINTEVTNGSSMKGLYNNTDGDPEFCNYLLATSSISNIKVDNGSSMISFYLEGRCYFQNLEVTNASMFIGLVLFENSFISFTNVNNYSYFGDFIWMFNSYITFVDVDNNSQLYGDSFGNGDINLSCSGDAGPGVGSYIQNVAIKNNSSITGINFDLIGDGGSYLENITLNNNSYIYNLNFFNGSYFKSIDITNESGINSVNLCDSSGSGAALLNIILNNNSYISNDYSDLYLEDSSYIQNLIMNNYSCLSGINMYNNSTIDYVNIINGSYVEDLYLNNSTIDYVNIINGSEYYTEDYNNSYIYNLELNDSYMGSNGLTNSSIGETVLNNSEISGNILISSSEISDLTLSDSEIYNNNISSSNLSDIQMNDSNIYNNNLSEGSGLTDLILNASDIYGSSLNDSSINVNQLYSGSIHNITMGSSYMSGCIIRSSLIDTVTVTSGMIEDVEMINDSTINNCYFIGEGLHMSSLKSSTINTTSLNGNSINYLYMRDAVFSEYSSTASFYNLDMVGSTFNFGGDSSYIIPNYTRFDTNTIKYQFGFTFSGDTGYGDIGNVNIPKMLIPYNGTGWYIQSVIVDNRNTGATLSIGGTYSYMNIGNTTDTDTGLDDSRGDVLSMADNITVSDMSNGGADGMKTDSISYIVMNVEGHSINAGNIYVEIILKNTNYGTHN